MSPASDTGKSPSAFRTISEVGSELDLPQHVLRFWETKFTQVRPLKRGGGRRYYRPEDIDLLRRIRHLLYEEGYTIKGVQKLFREGAVSSKTDHVAAAVAPIAPSQPESDASDAAPGAEAPAVDVAELKAILRDLEDLRATLDTTG